MGETTPGRDRLRELLDAVLDEENATLGEMAADAYASPYHFTRQLSRGAGEPPVAMRRRVMLERAAWQLRQGRSVTDTAFAAGYDSVEGFSRAFARAFGQPPSTVAAGPGTHWLPAPNGIHFHPPTSLWVEQPATPSAGVVTLMLVEHDLDDTRDLLEAAKGVDEAGLGRVRLAGHEPLPFDQADETLRDVLHHLVRAKEVWLASIEGAEHPPAGPEDVPSLVARHEEVAPRWLAAMRDLERRGAWGDRLVDALCEPPESFVLGSVLAHVLTYSAHRRQLARWMLGDAVPRWPEGDPITWLRRRTGGIA
ncbi:helix-turn-helix domain-containing protein [Nocardioides campestrisoli]|uniref:helix-turn-helix domain-containing protein n=1 Tax=Nocardioides campestrisoli TaxID=2736757 RepID=UPI0015E6FEB6|nr:helix-turn-helix domain-containing protein [Nocardioides campestrisoli]